MLVIFNLYTANHASVKGIEDYIIILRRLLAEQGYTLHVSRSLNSKAINIIIDEFSNYITNQEIITFKSNNPTAILVFVLTEFIEERYLISTFNYYGKFRGAAYLAFVNIYLRRARTDFLAASFNHFLVAILYSPVFIIFYLKHKIDKILKKKQGSFIDSIRSLYYLHNRYLGLERMISYADSVILSHQMIEAGLRKISTISIAGTLLPLVNFDDIKNLNFAGKSLYIEVTGSITQYRRNVMSQVNQVIDFFQARNIGICEPIPFEALTDANIKRGAYSLHPPQTKNWRYSSPTRIFRAFYLDRNMRILTKIFNQHPIECLTLEYEGVHTLVQMTHFYNHPEKLLEYLEPKVGQYLQLAECENNKIMRNLEKLDTLHKY